VFTQIAGRNPCLIRCLTAHKCASSECTLCPLGVAFTARLLRTYADGSPRLGLRISPATVVSSKILVFAYAKIVLYARPLNEGSRPLRSLGDGATPPKTDRDARASLVLRDALQKSQSCLSGSPQKTDYKAR
jgi:hypothetical protein